MATDSQNLNDRTKRILATLVREHIATGEPVASQILVRKGGFSVSSATIRNVLAQLEERGYVRQPHTSAGRVPTDMGYRAYVDQLLEEPRTADPTATADAQLLEHLANGAAPETVMAAVPHMLAQASHTVAFALTPEPASAAFHRIDFVPLGSGRVLVVVVSRNSDVNHKVIELDENLDVAALEQASNYLNGEFSGLPLSDVRQQILDRLGEERVLFDRLMARALRLAQSSFDDLRAQHALYVEGAWSLVDEVSEPYSGITLSALSTVVKLIEDKRLMIRLLSEYLDNPGLTIIIGGEHSDPTLRQFSLVAATFEGGDSTGAVGLIGPLRMQYSRAIPMVGGVAQTVSRVFGHAGKPPHPAGS
jgi:heat-inducible transcriptional repressor